MTTRTIAALAEDFLQVVEVVGAVVGAEVAVVAEDTWPEVVAALVEAVAEAMAVGVVEATVVDMVEVARGAEAASAARLQ